MIADDADDEWFMSSIKRYKDLVMFDTGSSVLQVELCDRKSICTLSRRGVDKRVISLLSLPSKIVGNSHSYIIKQNTDLKIVSGIFPTNNPTQILSVFENDRLVSSEEDVRGVTLYNLKTDTDQILLDKKLNFPLYNPNLALMDYDKIVMTKFTSDECLVGDLNSGGVLNSIIFDNNNDIIKPVGIDPNTMAFCFKKSSVTHLFDVRTNATIGQEIKVSEDLSNIWVPFTDFCFYKKGVTADSIYYISKTGQLKRFDLRNLSSPCLEHTFPLSTYCGDHLRLQFNPDNKDVLSLSGFDDSIYLYNIRNDLTEVFRHDGHAKTEYCVRDTVATDHFWYSDELVISCALNNSLNCWSANVNFNNIVV